MTYKTLGIFALAGAIAWTGATLFYAGFGELFIERAFWFYAVNAVLTGVILTVLFHRLTRATGIDKREWLAPSLAFAAPSFLLSIAFAPGLLRLFASTAPQTSSRYSLYLFVAYTLVVAVAVSPRPALARA